MQLSFGVLAVPCWPAVLPVLYKMPLRGSSKVQPHCSLPTTGSGPGVSAGPASAPSSPFLRDLKAEASALSYATLASPASPSVDQEPAKPQRTRRLRWLSSHPRLGFFLLFAICSYASGVLVAYQLTSLGLGALGVQRKLSSAREVYRAASNALSTMSSCVEQAAIQHLADAKTKFEADSTQVQQLLDRNDRVLVDQENTTLKCSTSFLTVLQEQVESTATEDTNSSLACFSGAFYADMPNIEPQSASQALMLSVRALLAAQVVSATRDSLDQQQAKMEEQLLKMWQAVDSVRTSILSTMRATSDLVMTQLSSITPIFASNSSHSEQSVSRLGRLSKVAPSELASPFVSATSSTTLETIRKVGNTLRKALEFLSGLHEGVSEVLDTLDSTWNVLEEQLNATVRQATELQQELSYAAQSTAYQINQTTTSLTTTLEQAEQEVTTAFNQLQEQWNNAAEALVAQGFAPWQRLSTQLVAELTENKRQAERPRAAVQRRSVLSDQMANSSLAQNHKRLIIASRDQRAQGNDSVTSLEPPSGEKFDIDTAVLQAALVDTGTLFIRLLFYVDVGRLVLVVTDLAVGLLSESYSDMPMVDIRGITTVDTVASLWEIFLCKHSFSAVCYTLVTQSTELVRFLVRFLLLALMMLGITNLLYSWKQEHLHTCDDTSDQDFTSQTVVQSITRTLFENGGESSTSVVDPLDVIEKYAALVNDSIQDDYANLASDSATVWKSQSVTLNELKDYVATTSTLVRTLQDCSQVTEMAPISSQCLSSNLGNATGLESPHTIVEQQAESVAFLNAPTFDSCFPQVEQFHMQREIVVNRLQHSLACATEKAVYLSLASWWLLLVIFVANRFSARMLLKGAGIYWWRFLSAGRLHFVGFCKDDGSIMASDELPHAVQRLLREVKWRVAGRVIGIVFAAAWVLAVACVVLQGMI